MKEVIVFVLALLLLSSTVLAVGPADVVGAGTGIDDREAGNVNTTDEKGNSELTDNSNNSGNGIKEREQEQNTLRLMNQARNVTELKEMIRQRQQEMDQELQNAEGTQGEILKNQNQVRLAVHALLAMENLSGGLGKNISTIAREFNNSVQATIRAEERIQNRNALVEFFIGGDKEAAGELERETNQNQLRMEELKRLRDECNCTSELKQVFQEQIQNIEEEQNRLRTLAQEEKKSNGIFGWLFG